jgi:hypothetical protein
MCDVLIAGRLVFWRNRKLPAAIDQRHFFLPIINDETMMFSWGVLAIFPSERTKFHVLTSLLYCSSGRPNMVNVKLLCELYGGV